MKGIFTYQCHDCEELVSHVPNGCCPICGSQAVVPLGWYQLSPDERGGWLDRIRGRFRHSHQGEGTPLPSPIASVEPTVEKTPLSAQNKEAPVRTPLYT